MHDNKGLTIAFSGTPLAACPLQRGVRRAERRNLKADSPRRPKAGGVGLSDLLDALKRQLATASTHPYQVCASHMCSSGSLRPELLGKPDEKSFGAPDVAEPIRVFVLDHFADELRTAFAEPGERIVDVLHGKHDA